jgi:osmotically-inducible protein OsmY
MRYAKAITIAIALLFGAAGIGGCASEPTTRTSGTFVDDATTTAKVKAALARDRDVSAMDVNVTTYRGVVQLSGFVDNENQVRRAGEVARGVDGVKDVYNDVHVKPAS